jgi:hypothetical protein
MQTRERALLGLALLLELPFHLLVAYIGGGIGGVVFLARMLLGWALD